MLGKHRRHVGVGGELDVDLDDRLGVPDEQAIAFGLLLYFLTLACSLIGLPALMFGGGRRTLETAAIP